MRLNALYLITLTLTLTTARALPSNNGIGPIIIEPVDERTNRFVGPGSDLEKCGSDMDCQFLSCAGGMKPKCEVEAAVPFCRCK
ncbi:uncharacterized protein ASPGLDRAFT_45367 [Aspergillus glaucus CBS 516.65]|uniref:Uncharacterized protein n=1 Tax=Aspergillus glaucus CBS 516.65 TaxID=1160497 RepID=A0A1L9VNC9_ASPGL|nr:hypothetical protein ASPGLDRAFT_45367 [Aspergillus glaucus CBS 516.65]OJJ85402.1 hypothetical protein ASPGLDRAFT_45367 [Aspergillus glaucus CBS 516.65]